jgi:hypothetical protein
MLNRLRFYPLFLIISLVIFVVYLNDIISIDYDIYSNEKILTKTDEETLTKNENSLKSILNDKYDHLFWFIQVNNQKNVL